MRKLCPNLDREDGLETVLEVPVPEEMLTKMGSNAAVRWRNMHALMKAVAAVNAAGGGGGDRLSLVNHHHHHHLQSKSDDEFVALLKIVGSPLIPFQVPVECCLSRPINDPSIEASTAKYIVQQYVAASGGQAALNAVKSMYAVGEVKMHGSEMLSGDAEESAAGRPSKGSSNTFEVGGFVLWQKNPNLWFLELVVSGFKISAGSDGKVAWNQSSTQPSHAHRGPPRPLRRFFQGLDPRSAASLFLDAVCIGEETVNGEDCFVLKLETSSDILKAQCSPNTEVMHHTIWGYFSHRTGLLVKFSDTKLVRVKSARGKSEGVFWETSVESIIDDYKFVDSINIAHGGRTVTTLYRYGGAVNHRRKIEETWKIEEVDFNICGLSMESFLPPSEVNKDQDGGDR